MVGERGNSLKDGFIALDEFEFIGTDQCQFKPLEADPLGPTTDSTTDSTTIPTEPPWCTLTSMQYTTRLINID